MTYGRWARQITVLGAVIALGAVACGGGTSNNSSPGSSGSGGTVSISDEYGVAWNCQFNPYNGSDEFGSFGPVYEELVYMDSLKNGATTPWLATSWAWSNDDKTLTFTIRNGVKWSDGKPFSAKDVLYSFNLLKKNPALDLNSDWSVLSSVAAKGSNQVVFQFKTAAVPYFYYIADETPIVPEHIWSTIKEPGHLPRPDPDRHRAVHDVELQRRQHPVQEEPRLLAAGPPEDRDRQLPVVPLEQRGQRRPGERHRPVGLAVHAEHQGLLPRREPEYYHYWFEPTYNVNIYFNLKNPLLHLAVRQAMSYAINRARSRQIGESGYEPASNQTSIVKPTFSSWYDSSQARPYGNAYAYDPAKAISDPEAAGYKRGSNGIFAKNGKPLSFTIINNGGFSDWVAAVNVIQSDLKAVGIALTPRQPLEHDVDCRPLHRQLPAGLQLGLGRARRPYYELRAILYSANTAPIGKSAATNWERYSNPATDALFEQYASTTSAAVQHQVVDELQKVMLADVPVIPVTEAVDWYQYDTQSIGGWVTPSDPYAQPDQYAVPDWGVVLLHLYEK